MSNESDRTQISSAGEHTVVGDSTVISEKGETVLFECVQGREVELATEPRLLPVLFRVSSPGLAPGRRMPVSLCVVIDRSGSMEGQPLECAKRACNYVVDSLDQDDLLSIVCFDDRIDVIMPPRKVVNRELIKQHIAPIQARGTTNIYEAIGVAGSQLASVGSAGVSRIILLTDGAPTAGPEDYSSIVGQAQAQKERGITLSTLGFGIEYNEELLAGMARVSRGSHYYISDPELIPEIFRSELGSILSLVARDLELSLRLPRWVQGWRVYGKEADFGRRSLRFGMMDLEAGSSIATVVELMLHPRPGGQYRIAEATLTYEDCLSGGARRESHQSIVVEFVGDPAQVPEEISPAVNQELQVAAAAQNLEKTMAGLSTMELSRTQVAQELEATRTALVAQGRNLEATQVDQAIQSMAKGADSEAGKTLMATLYGLESGKKREAEAAGAQEVGPESREDE